MLILCCHYLPGWTPQDPHTGLWGFILRNVDTNYSIHLEKNPTWNILCKEYMTIKWDIIKPLYEDGVLLLVNASKARDLQTLCLSSHPVGSLTDRQRTPHQLNISLPEPSGPDCTRRTMEGHLEPNRVLQSDNIEEPFLVPRRTFQTRVL